MLRVNILFLLLFALERQFTIAASPRAINLKYTAVQPPKPTQPPAKMSTRGTDEELRRRQVTSIGSKTCGYYDGDPTKFRTADGGYGCRLDINNGLWGFCPITVISPKDCGLAGACEDKHACTNGCGKTGIEGLTTFTCSSTNQYCSTVILKGDYEGGFSYIACGAQAVVETLFQSPTVAAVPSGTITPDSSTASETETTSISTDAKSSQASTSSTSTGATATGALQSSTESTAAASETATPAGRDNSDGDSSSTPNTTGIIIGGVIGGIAIVCVTVVTAVYLLRRNRKENNEGRSSRFFSWRKSSQKPPTYDQSEATQVDQNLQYTADNNKTYAGWGPAEVYGSEAWRNPTAPVEMPSAPAPPVELPSRRY